MEKGQVMDELVEPPKDYFVLSIVSIFFCPLFGIMAVWKAGKSRDKLRKGNDWDAEINALNALKWAMAAFAIGGAVYFMAVALLIYWLVVYYFGGEKSPFIDL